ncbi:hypothetical protein L7D48_05550 [Streptomyces sp. S1A]|nr:hypothetical protein [Streptomyces sp. ICN903]
MGGLPKPGLDRCGGLEGRAPAPGYDGDRIGRLAGGRFHLLADGLKVGVGGYRD